MLAHSQTTVRSIYVIAGAKLIHRVGVNLTHLGDADGLLALIHVDPGASSGETSDGASR